MQLSPQASSHKHLLLRPLQSSSIRHFLRQVWPPGIAITCNVLLEPCRRLPHRVVLTISAWMWADSRREPGRFLPNRLPASVSVHQQRSSFNSKHLRNGDCPYSAK